MKGNKSTSPIVVVAFFPFFILKYAYYGILEITGVNKKRHSKEDNNINVQSSDVNNNVQLPEKVDIPVQNVVKEDNINKKDNLDVLDNNKVLKQKESFTGKENTNYTFNYAIKLNNGKLYKNSFDAPNIQEVERFLKNEGYEVVKIVPRSKYDIDINLNSKMNVTTLAFSLTQLSTYLKAGIPLVDAVRIISKQSTKKNERKIWDKVTYALLTGKSFSEALGEQDKVFPAMLINMVKTAELTGALTEILDDMADYYTSTSQTRKEMKSALTYPIVILIIAIIVTAFMLTVIVPQFVSMFEQQNATIPAFTKFIMNTSNFMKNNYIILIIILLVLLITYRLLYKNIKAFRRAMQSIYMKIPVFGNIIIYSEVTIFTKTFASLVQHGVKIADSMDILLKISNNEIYKELISTTIVNLTKGKNVSEAFKDSWAFPVVAYEMIVTGENTGQLGPMMEKVSQHFSNLHKNMINSMKSLIEPIMILFLGVVVGAIILAIIIPMFSIYDQLS